MKKSADEIIRKSKKKGKYADGIDQLNNEAVKYRNEGDYETAIEFAKKGSNFAKEYDLILERSYCERTLSEIYALIGNREKSMEHCKTFKNLAKKCNHKSQIQLSYHVEAWCIEKLYVSGAAGKIDLENALKSVETSKYQIEINEKELKMLKINGTVTERKALLYSLEARLYEMLGNEKKAREIIQNAISLPFENKNISYDISMVQLCLAPKEEKLKLAEKIVKDADDKKGNALIEYSHLLVLNNEIEHGYSTLVQVYVDYTKTIFPDDLFDLEKRLPILYKLIKYKEELRKENSKLTKCELYEAIGDLYDSYYGTLSEKEKREYSEFAKVNILENYFKMINYKSDTKDEIRALLAIGLIYQDLNDWQNSMKYLEKRKLLLIENDCSEKIVLDNEASIFLCMCKLNLNGIEEKFEELRKNVTYPTILKEIYGTWADYLEFCENKKESKEFQSLADELQDSENENENEKMDKLFDGLSDKTILSICKESYEKVKIEHKLLQKKDQVINNNGETHLHEAAKNSDHRIVEKMCKMGYNVNARDNGGWTPLSEAVTHNEIKNVQILINFKADVNSVSMEAVENLDGKRGPEHRYVTPLMDACCNGFVDIAKLLIENNAKIETRDSLGWTAWNHLECFIENKGMNDEQKNFEMWFKTLMIQKGISLKPIYSERSTFTEHLKFNSQKYEIFDSQNETEDFVLETNHETSRKRRLSAENYNISKRRNDMDVVFLKAVKTPRNSISPVNTRNSSPIFSNRIQKYPSFSSTNTVKSNSPIKATSNIRSHKLSDLRKKRINESVNDIIVISPKKKESSIKEDLVPVKFHFITPSGSVNKIENMIKPLAKNSKIEEIKSILLKDDRIRIFDGMKISRHDDIDQCVLSDDLCLSLLDGNISLDVNLSIASPHDSYIKNKEIIPEVLLRLKKMETQNNLDLSNLFLDEQNLLKISKSLESSIMRENGKIDLSRCELTAEMEKYLRSIVRSGKSLSLRVVTSEDQFQILFDAEDSLKLEELLMAVIDFEDQNQLGTILTKCSNLQSLSLISVRIPPSLSSSVSNSIQNLKQLSILNLSAITWLTVNEWTEILSNLEQLKICIINDIVADFHFQNDWLPNLIEFSSRRSQLNWFSVIEFLSVSNVKKIDVRGSNIDKTLLNDLQQENLTIFS